MLTREDLIGLGISPGPTFARIFNAVKDAPNKAEALAIAVAIRDGTFEPSRHESRRVVPFSVLEWLIDFPACPWVTLGRWPVSNSDKWRILEQGAVTLNGKKPEPDDPMPDGPITELVFFKGSKRQCTIF